MTADLNALSNIQQLKEPIIISLAVSGDETMASSAECAFIGDLTVQCNDVATITTKCFYNPLASIEFVDQCKL
jgi:hypothetical protein